MHKQKSQDIAFTYLFRSMLQLYSPVLLGWITYTEPRTLIARGFSFLPQQWYLGLQTKSSVHIPDQPGIHFSWIWQSPSLCNQWEFWKNLWYISSYIMMVWCQNLGCAQWMKNSAYKDVRKIPLQKSLILEMLYSH